MHQGLARGLFRVTQDCTSAGRDSCAAVDADAGRGPTAVIAGNSDSAGIVEETDAATDMGMGMAGGCDTSPIVIEASGTGQ